MIGARSVRGGRPYRPVPREQAEEELLAGALVREREHQPAREASASSAPAHAPAHAQR
jgi:hypothetical protein